MFDSLQKEHQETESLKCPQSFLSSLYSWRRMNMQVLLLILCNKQPSTKEIITGTGLKNSMSTLTLK